MSNDRRQYGGQYDQGHDEPDTVHPSPVQIALTSATGGPCAARKTVDNVYYVARTMLLRGPATGLAPLLADNAIIGIDYSAWRD